MTKAEIVQAIYSRLGGFSKKEAADLVDLVFETMKETLGRGEKIKISGFGNFELRDKRSRPGRNPQTGDPIVITERRVLSFKASNILKNAVNPERGAEPGGDAGQVGAGQAGGGQVGGGQVGGGQVGGGQVGGGQAVQAGGSVQLAATLGSTIVGSASGAGGASNGASPATQHGQMVGGDVSQGSATPIGAGPSHDPS